MPKQPPPIEVPKPVGLKQRDWVLFVLGGLAGATTLFAGGSAALAAPFIVAAVSGIMDGWASPRLRPVGSWLPAWVGSILAPAYALTIDVFRDPPAPDGGLALSVGLAFMGVGSLMFIGLAVMASVIARSWKR